MMHAQLVELAARLSEVTRRATALVAGLDAAAFRQRPAEGRWSVAECLVHLNLTSQATLPEIDAALTRARPGFTGRYRRGVVGALLAWSLEPGRGRYPTTASFTPTGSGSRVDVLAEFTRLQNELTARLEQASGLTLNRLKVRSPFNAKVRYNLYAAFCIIAVHQRRHLAQAEAASWHSRDP